MGVTHDCDGKTTGSVCIAQCDAGYERAAMVFTCEGDGSLSGSSPICTALACTSNFPSGLGVTHDCDGKTTGDTCVAACDVGYVTVVNITSGSAGANMTSENRTNTTVARFTQTP